VIRGLIGNLDDRFASGSARPAELAALFLAAEDCAAARGLSEEDRARLKEIAARAPAAGVSR
jgi:hypothetical protein